MSGKHTLVIGDTAALDKWLSEFKSSPREEDDHFFPLLEIDGKKEFDQLIELFAHEHNGGHPEIVVRDFHLSAPTEDQTDILDALILILDDTSSLPTATLYLMLDEKCHLEEHIDDIVRSKCEVISL